MLVKTAGVKHLIVVINKMDDPTVLWTEERYVINKMDDPTVQWAEERYI